MIQCKRTRSALLTLVVLAVTVVVVAVTAGGAKAQFTCPASCTNEPLQIGSVSGTNGEQVFVDILLNNSPSEVAAWAVILDYDVNMLTYVSCEPGDLTQDFNTLLCNENTAGTVTTGGFQPASGDPIPAGASGSVVRLTFDVDCATCVGGEQSDLIPTSVDDEFIGLARCCGTFTYVAPAQQSVCPGEPSSCDGATIRVPILVSEPNGLQNIELHLQYDGVSATYMTTERSGLTQNWTTLTGVENTSGDITIQGSDIVPISAVSPDTLCYVVFQTGLVGPDMVLTTTGFAGDLAGTNDCETTVCTVPSEESTWGRIKSLWSDM